MVVYLTAEPETETWMSNARCSSTDPELFFPTRKKGNEQGNMDNTSIAQEICNDCPVKLQCLAYAMAYEKERGRRYGIYGGLGPDQRRKLQIKIDNR